MSAANPAAGDLDCHELAAWCAQQLRQEETLLAAALPVLRAVQEAFTRSGFDALAAALGRHQEIAQLIEALNVRRLRFREACARRLEMAPGEISWATVLARLPEAVRPALAADAARVRGLAEELAAANYMVSVQVRVHLDAYRRILRDLTNTSAGSGRYGPAGTTEALEYRPLIHIHG